ncbi:MAG: inositol monophosphatase family protein [Methyloligellaceae bacterium]
MPASALMNVMISAVRKAGRGLARDFGEVENLQISEKGPGDFVSAADRKAEKVLYQELSKARPGYCFLLEESGYIEGADKTHRWIIDPLDGTTNFLHSIPLFGISVALEREGELVAAVFYNPVTNEMFTAEKGKGSFINDRRIRVAARNRFRDYVLTTGIPHMGRPGQQRFLTECAMMMGTVSGLRRTGSAATDLAWVAAGRFDGYWEYDIQPWDMAAGILLVKEAGGYVSDIDGKQDMFSTGGIIAGNESVQRDLVKIIKKTHLSG